MHTLSGTCEWATESQRNFHELFASSDVALGFSVSATDLALAFGSGDCDGFATGVGSMNVSASLPLEVTEDGKLVITVACLSSSSFCQAESSASASWSLSGGLSLSDSLSVDCSDTDCWQGSAVYDIPEGSYSFSAGMIYSSQSRAGATSTVCSLEDDDENDNAGFNFRVHLRYYPGDTVCPGDVNGNKAVDVNDLSAMSAAYGSVIGDSNYNANADFDGDGDVDLSDYSILLSNYGETC